MAANFKVFKTRNYNKLHLNLHGDFDGISAHQLIDILDKNCRNVSKVFVHTTYLKQIHPFGSNVFHTEFKTLKISPLEIEFTGQNADKIVPE